MALLTMSEIREMNSEERKRRLADYRAELAKQRAAMMSGAGMENPGVIRGIRKNIARILTVINEERRAAESIGGE
ncbi:MAG: 50S ribosomal protein L29 [Candidatus Odinarchaeota archaeon]